ncbi:MAG: oxidoreductase [Chloroflexi bacterium]|nr:oxidoreductase [Chloroflexota bacterium]|tara:strand:+ start:12124 stop:13104 length:981 start_codon:yes stop_codon:yes gene_type:complete
MDLPKIGVIGCGYWGKNLVRVFNELGCLVAVSDSTSEGREIASQIAPNVQVLSTLDQMLQIPVEAVVISTPAETHFSLTEQVLKSGKDVLVEKPFAMNRSESEKLVLMASEYQRILMVGHVMEYHPGIVKLTELISDGILGEIRYVYSNRVSLGKIRREENILFSFAPHDIAVINRLINSAPKFVSTSGGDFLQPNIADVTVSNITYENGSKAHIFVSWLHPFKEQRLVVIGSENMASFDDVSKELILYDQKVDINDGVPVPIKGIGKTVSFPDLEPLKEEALGFINSINTRIQPKTSGINALKVMDVLDASQKSMSLHGKPIYIN